MYGYHGKVLVVDLSLKTSRWDYIPEDIYRNYLGGIGLGTYLLYRYCPPQAEPLSEDNPLIFATSPFVGSRLTTTSKFAVLAKSPLTSFIADSLSSSHLADALKSACGDALILLNRAQDFTLLHIDNGKPVFMDASGLVGLSTFDTEKSVKDLIGKNVRVASIGPAGENQVLYASIANDGGRQAGRCGLGAVMGFKNIKALAINGEMTTQIYDPEGVECYRRKISAKSLGEGTDKYRNLGTMANVSLFNRFGILPTKNFQQATFENADKISGEELFEKHFEKNAYCSNCTIGCEKILVTTDNGKKNTGRMEYESLFAFGPLCNVDDPNTIIRAARLCDELGMDTVSCGATIAWAMECYEKGISIDAEDEGINLSFLESRDLLKTVSMIGHREGIGDLLALGSKRASEIIGERSDRWAMHVKGLEMPGYEPRSLKTMALGFAITPRGACHNRTSGYEADLSGSVDRFGADNRRSEVAVSGEDFTAVLDSLVWCKFLRKAFDDFYSDSAEAYNLITGLDITPAELKVCGERINNLKKLFNIREGWRRCDDTLPHRILNEPLPDGVMPGVVLSQEELDTMVEGYYVCRGWTKDGLIPSSKMCELGLDSLLVN